MLLARSSRHGLVNLLEYSRQEIEIFREVSWQCLSCQQSVILKNGAVMAPHFAHRAKTACASFSEGESEEHLRGKALLAQWCQASNLEYELEAYLPRLKQRPDVLVAGKIALEFQCSPLPLKQLLQRTETYLAHGYQVIWLLGARFFLKDKLSTLAQQILAYRRHYGFYFWELDSQQEELRCHYQVEQVLGLPRVNRRTQSWSVGSHCLRQLLSLSFAPATPLLLAPQPVIEAYFNRLEERLYRREPQALILQGEFYQRRENVREISNLYCLPVTLPVVLGEETLLWRWEVWRLLREQKGLSLADLLLAFSDFVATRQLGQGAQRLLSTERQVALFLSHYLQSLSLTGFISLASNRILVKQQPGRLISPAQRRQSLQHYLQQEERNYGRQPGNMLLYKVTEQNYFVEVEGVLR